MLVGKTAFITGAGGGIGRSTAIMMSKKGAVVFIIGRNEKNLKETIDRIRENGGEADYAICDVTNVSEVQNAVKKAVELYGKIDTLVNNAAVFLKTDILSEELESSWEDNLNVNVMGMIHVIHACIPYLIKNKKSSITNIASIDAYSGCKDYTGYSASKGAVISLTRGLAKDLGDYYVRVNAVAPGITETPMTHDRIENGRDKYLTNVVLKRIGKDEDIANATIFLASDMADYITGEVLNVNGGMQFI